MNKQTFRTHAPWFAIAVCALSTALPCFGNAQGAGGAQKPSIWLVGDGTMQVWSRGLLGWGHALWEYVDTDAVAIENRAQGGRSSRSFMSEGIWERVLRDVKPGDAVMIQFGHHDAGRIDGGYPHGRASLPGTGEETAKVLTPLGKEETVHTFGWYLRKYIADVRAKGATPVVLSTTPRLSLPDGKVVPGDEYVRWAREVSEAAGAAFIDLHAISAQRLEKLGGEAAKALYAEDGLHTVAGGARLHARSAAWGIARTPGFAFAAHLRPLFLTAGGYGDRIVLRWADCVAADSFDIHRKNANATTSQCLATGLVDTTWVDTNALVRGEAYTYVVTGRTTGGDAIESNLSTAVVTDLVVRLAFDDSQATRAEDSSGNTWHATIHGDATRAPGVDGQALAFSGKEQHAALPTGIAAPLDDITICAWIKTPNTRTWARIFDFGSGTDNFMFLTSKAGGIDRLRFAIRTPFAPEQDVAASVDTPTNRWFHVAVTRCGDRATLYLDGRPVGTNERMTLSPEDLGATPHNYLGRSQWPDPLFEGLIDDFRIYARAIAEDELARLMEESK